MKDLHIQDIEEITFTGISGKDGTDGKDGRDVDETKIIDAIKDIPVYTDPVEKIHLLKQIEENTRAFHCYMDD